MLFEAGEQPPLLPVCDHCAGGGQEHALLISELVNGPGNLHDRASYRYFWQVL